MSQLRRALLVILAVVALIGTACSKGTTPPAPTGEAGTSSTSGGSDALSGVAAATAAAADQGSVRMDFTMKLEGPARETPPPGADAFSMKGTSEIDYANDASHSIIDMPMLGKMETIQIGNVSYIRSDLMSGMTGSSEQKWMKGSASSTGTDVMAGSLGGSDPSAMFAFLAGASSLEEVGTEQVGGVDTTHYTGTINPSDISQNLPQDQAKQVRDSISAIGMGEMPFDVWVDSDGLVRRVTFTFDFSAMAGISSPVPGTEMPKSAKMVMTMDLYDYGVPLSIEAPPAAEIVKMPNMSNFPSGLMPEGMPTP